MSVTCPETFPCSSYVTQAGAYPEIFLEEVQNFFSSYTQVIVLFVNSNDT